MSDENTPLPLSLPRKPQEPTIQQAEPEKPPPSSFGQRVKEGARDAAPKNKAQTIMAIASLVVAMGGGATVQGVLGPAPMTKQQADDILKNQAEMKKMVVDYAWQRYDADVERGKIQDSVLCKMNGGSFARKVECEAVQDWESIPLGQEKVGPFKAQWDYPQIPQPPVKRTQ